MADVDGTIDRILYRMLVSAAVVNAGRNMLLLDNPLAMPIDLGPDSGAIGKVEPRAPLSSASWAKRALP